MRLKSVPRHYMTEQRQSRLGENGSWQVPDKAAEKSCNLSKLISLCSITQRRGLYLTMAFAILIAVSPSGFPKAAREQQPSKPADALAISNTTWDIYARINKSDSWGEVFTQLHFFPDETAEEIRGGYRTCRYQWSLRGNRLKVFTTTKLFEKYKDECAPLIETLNLTIKDKEMTGTGMLGMNPRPFFVRLLLRSSAQNK
jgi:hypothetical protein